MDKQSFIEKLKLLNLPLGEYYILSSGSLLLYGLREQVGDIDLCVSQKLFDVFLKDKYLINEQDKNECGFYKLYDDIEFIVNDAILEEAKKKGFSRLYLKTDLTNYYEKFGAMYIEDLNDGEKLYFFDI